MRRGPPGKLKGAGKALFTLPPTAEEIEASGFAPEDFETDDFEVWPDNWRVYSLFESLRTQWQQGFNGPTNLNYCAVYPLLDRVAEGQTDWWALFNDLRVLEAGAREAIAARKP